MKYTTTILLACLLSFQAQSQLLEAKPVALALEAALKTKMTYKETGKLSGFNTTQSCVYVSDQLIVIENYCFPKKEYPARSFTILSPKFGLIDLYQEQLTDTINKRDVHIQMFPVPLKKQLKDSLANYTVEELNKLMDKTENKYAPGCWSTNFSYYTENADANCSVGDVQDFQTWEIETQKLTADIKNWNDIFNQLNQKFDK